MRVALYLLCLALTAISRLGEAAEFPFVPPDAVAAADTPAIMRDLAARLIPVYEDPDPDRYLANLSVLQLAAGDYASADQSRQSLRDRRAAAAASSAAARPVQPTIVYDLYARSRFLEKENGVTFAEGFRTAFGEMVSGLDDRNALAVARWLETSLPAVREALDSALTALRTRDRIDATEAVALIRTYLSFDAQRAFQPYVAQLDAEEDGRRYSVDDVRIRAAGATLIARVIRPKRGDRLPSLFEFTMADSPNDARECAAHGYVSVVAWTDAKDGKPRVVPFEHTGDHAGGVIEWIVRQPWSDGRVAMYGAGYSGFAAWAAAKRLPHALKAIATMAADAPGIDVPMSGNIFWNSAYRLSAGAVDAAGAAGAADVAEWRALDRTWYASGRRYRDLGRMHGTSNPIFIRWLNHPSYDRYWQKMIPYRQQFAKINIPVLTMTGYFADNEPGDLYYFTQHHRFNARADQTLVMGPYDGTEPGSTGVLKGYRLDPAALADLRELRFQWFDHIFKGSAVSPLLSDRVNYEVMGANEWRHVPSLDAMADAQERFYLDAAVSGVDAAVSGVDAAVSGGAPRLTQRKPAKPGFIRQTVSWADRSDADWTPPTALVGKGPDTRHGTLFVSDALTAATEIGGLISGRLDLYVNKMDVDLYVVLYELLANGDTIQLFSPAMELRASYASDRVHRHLLKAGERQELKFKSERLTSRRLQKGSRLGLVLGVVKRPDREINYGAGNDVSEESLADGRVPLKIRWYAGSYIDLPVRR